ncbi:MAG: tRNA 2-thiouridine(34) synthase MnmA, partial [Deltaproteobacteria bacterium]
MSGGVDSSTAAFLLQREGHEVVGVSLDLYDFSGVTENRAGTCCSLDDIYDARRVCSHLGIPHYVFNFRDYFEESVIEVFVNEYARGRTPNPCVLCNDRVKFDYLLKRAKALGFDYVATGHYARIEEKGGVFRLKRGVDREKDQSYFLYSLNQDNLPYLLFPCGHYEKGEVRKIAAEAGLPVSDKEESQEICFVTENSTRNFLIGRGLRESPGEVVTVDGRVVGRHAGAFGYTIGQRRGLGVALGKPHYVIHIDPVKNRIVIGPEEFLFSSGAVVEEYSFVEGAPPSDSFPCTVKIRYRGREVPSTVQVRGETLRVVFHEPVKSVTPGQYAVFYDGDTVIGG